MIEHSAMHSSNELQLLAVDTAGIQKYIFSSNRLRENIGASHLIASVTGQWAFEAILKATSELGGHHNILDVDGTLSDVKIEQPDTAAEVLYSGGGNFVVLFRNGNMQKRFVQTLSRRVLQEAPGLRLMIHSVPFVLDKDVLGEKLKQLFQEMKAKRSTEPSAMPAAGLSVTVMCHSTALPAVGMAGKTGDDDERPASAEVLAKLDAADSANSRLERTFPLEQDHKYPLDFDDLGRTRGETSLIAVVHADGDGIGKRIEAIGVQYKSPAHLRKHVNELRWFSRNLAQAAQNAQKGTVEHLWQLASDSVKVAELFERHYVPFRPLVFGGDDITFVSDGRIGLALTLEYLQRFQFETEQLLNERLTACAGVAIVKSHYPFARAYELAEELSKSAKKYRRESAPDHCCLDWHFTTGGIYGDLTEIRQREYTVKAGSLTLRPVTTSDNQMRSWGTIAAVLAAFQGDNWQEKRNKAKMLREKLRGGRESVKEFEALYGHPLPELDGFESGWSADGYSGYFDAIELMDLYLPLLQEENVNEPDAAS
ncbi:MAG: hypothetical protein SF162_18820 [bacterium]|nr:hypothetical protein [bacterium]